MGFPLLEIPFPVCNINGNALFLCLIRKRLLMLSKQKFFYILK